MALSTRASTRIALVHVCELGVDELDEQRLRRCDETLAEHVARHRRDRVEITRVLRSGAPWGKLDNVASGVRRREPNRDRTPRRGTWSGHRAIGWVAERLVRTASRPVLTVPFAFAPPGRRALS